MISTFNNDHFHSYYVVWINCQITYMYWHFDDLDSSAIVLAYSINPVAHP